MNGLWSLINTRTMSKKLDKLAEEMYGEFGFSTCSKAEQEEIIEEYREDLYNEVIQNFDYLNGYCLTGDEVQTIVSDIVEFVIYKLNTNTHG